MMFQYTHETIFNSLTMPDGTPRVVAPSEGDKKHGLVIKRAGEYYKNFIQNAAGKEYVVYKTMPVEGVLEEMTIHVNQLPDALGTYQLNMFIKLLDPAALYDYGYPNYNTFGKQTLVGFDRTPASTTESIAQTIYESLRYALDKEYATVRKEGTDIILRATNFHQRFDSLGIALYDETACDSCIGEYLPTMDILHNEDESKNAAEITVEGVLPFATGEWLQENMRFPSYPNIRYHAPGYIDYPVPGMKYVQFSFAYQSPRPQFGGLSGVGQDVWAVTRHIYYVPENLADEFEGYFSGMGCEIVETNEVEVTNPDTNAVDRTPEL